MKESQVTASIETGRLQLNASARFSHFFPSIALLIGPVTVIAMIGHDVINGTLYSRGNRPELFVLIGLFVVVPTVLAVGIYLVQRRRLKLTRFATTLSLLEIAEIMQRLAKSHR